MKKAQDELDGQVEKARRIGESDVKNMAYLQAIVKEMLRLYPPSHINGLRVCREDCTLSNGHRVPTETRVFVNIWKIHRDKRVSAYPNEFKPERFLTDHKHVDVSGQNFELIPFCSGRRTCPGFSLALNMNHFTLASLLQFQTPHIIRRADRHDCNPGVDVPLGDPPRSYHIPSP